MKIAVRIGKTAAALALALPVAALAQYNGVSHPDNAPIQNTPEIAQPPMLLAEPSAQPTLKPRAGIPVESASAGSATFRTVGPARETHPDGSSSAYTAPSIYIAPSTGAIADPDANIVTRLPGPPNELPAGTLVKVRLGQNISTLNTASGTAFTAQLIDGVKRDGRVLIPAGSTLSGLVTDVHGGKRLSGAATIHLRTTQITLPDGTRYPLRAQVIDTNLYKANKVDNEGTISGKDHAGKVASAMALTTGSGLAAGAVLGGVPGAVIGAAAGAGISTVVWLRQDRQTELPAETRVTFSLTEPLTVGLQ